MNLMKKNSYLETRSCSQESALMSDGTFEQLESMAALEGPFDDKENLDQALFQNPTVNLASYNSLPFQSMGKLLKTEDEENNATRRALYYPLSESYMPDPDMLIDPQKINFVYSLGEGGGTGQDWMYSSRLNKVFIKMEKTLPLRFAGWNPSTSGLYLRTAMFFKLEENKCDAVRRCHNHMAMTNFINQSLEPCRIKHVVHCASHQSEYQEKNEHLSVVTPLSKEMFEHGTQYITMIFQFLCKNSCQSGMNRRPTELVFTLEDCNGIVYGSEKLQIRICSSPKRDKDKEEESLASCASSTNPTNLSNRRKLPKKLSLLTKSSSFDGHVYKVELKIPGKENYLSIYKYAYDLLAGQAARSGRSDFFKPYMEEILRKTP